MDEMKKFFEFYGPLESDEVTAIVLLTRKKYCPQLKKSERTIDYLILRGPLTVDELTKMTKVFINKTMNAPLYTRSGVEVPKESLSFNILTNPVKKEHVVKKYTTQIVQQALDGNYDAVLRNSALLSAIMKCRGKKHLLFDIDVTGEKGLEIAREVIKHLPGPYSLVETHGGYHLLMKRGEWLKNLAEYKPPEGVEWGALVMTAIPNTLRGGKRTRLIEVKTRGDDHAED